MDIKIKLEPGEIEREIKEESELVIESDWLPTKFEDEENEYYQEFVQECNREKLDETVVKNEGAYEHFTIEYLDESGDYKDDYYVESSDESMEDDNDLDELETTEDVCQEDSKVLYELELSKWVADNYIKRKCPSCNEKCTNYGELRKHIILKHKESIEESDSNYYFSSDNCGVCKKCNQEIVTQFSRYVHLAKHSEDAAKLDIYTCEICNFVSKRFYVRKHIMEKHPKVVKEFKSSGSLKNLKCPLCSNTYIKHIHLCYHFMDKHPHEYKAKLRYNCHLCKQALFSEEENFLNHLIENHELNSWKILSYRKVFDDKEYFACKKCNRLFFRNDTFKLLSHFLKHEKTFRWSCKFCFTNINFKTSPVSHMCVEMVRYYEKNKVMVENIHKNFKTEGKINNLQKFEEHIAHVCPFCNEVFGKMIKWQHHLRADHEIDRLKGLEMKVIANDRNKLSCVICHTIVEICPEKLHAHRFQHLPYKPYKCLLCTKKLNTFKMAVNHILMQCKDEDNNLVEKIDDSNNIRCNLKMQCSSCNYKNIQDLQAVFKHYEDVHNYFEDFFIKHLENTMTCKICHKQYVQYEKRSCFLHLHEHFDEKCFKCKLCLQSYPTLRSVSNHLINLHNVKPLNEKKTNKEPLNEKKTNKEDLIANETKLCKSSVKSHVLNEFVEYISYACPGCNEAMATQKNWHTHIRTQHDFFDKSNLYTKQDDGSLKCPTCNIIFNFNLNIRTERLQSHKLTHMPYGSFMCNLCYMRYKTLSSLYSHLRHKHFAQGIFKCPICSEVLQTEHQRTMHIKEIHPRNDWPYTMCLICYKLFSNKSNLNAHMLIHDANRFRYTCDVCGAKLVKDITIHMNRHKMKGEIKEEMCDDVFLQSTSKCNQSNVTNDVEIVPVSEKIFSNKKEKI